MMKRILQRSLLLMPTLMIMMLLSACGEEKPDLSDQADTKTLTAEDVDIEIDADRESSIEEAVGVTINRQQAVLRYEDPASQITPEGVTSYYVSYGFKDGIMDTDTAMIWYGFSEEPAYREALNGYVQHNTDYFLKRYNDKALYYAYYVLPAVQDIDGDGELSWDEVMYDFENYEKENAELVR